MTSTQLSINDNVNANSSLSISDFTFLDELPSRVQCDRCGQSRRFFCYDCRLLITDIRHRVPTVNLPFNLHVIKHLKEKNSKSTGVHCRLLSPAHCQILDFPDQVPKYDAQTTMLVYPSPDASALTDVSNLAHITTFVLLDCTWAQTTGMRRHPNLSGLPTVKLQNYRTKFWRPQYKHPDTDLATVEAAYYLCREHYDLIGTQPYAGQYDNLLFFYAYFLSKIKNETFEDQTSTHTICDENDSNKD